MKPQDKALASIAEAAKRVMKKETEARIIQQAGYGKLLSALNEFGQLLMVPSWISLGSVLKLVIPIAFLSRNLAGSHSVTYKNTKNVRDVCCQVKPSNLDVMKIITSLLPEYMKGDEAVDKSHTYYIEGESDRLDKWRKTTALQFTMGIYTDFHVKMAEGRTKWFNYSIAQSFVPKSKDVPHDSSYKRQRSEDFRGDSKDNFGSRKNGRYNY